ncbi:hypothetical protein C7999DRAFT_40513 [Corynascus novoguineensis]|uniref:non-specific serine/threonine protein kinase n=1 Tax=Corynascus novoguineensis TaxID=1126955 RepID=A0AAN7CUL9_9PEZI|nr:hypothetical protein C7999DRAFT_40513 [Corynascus novoguineensis]
MADQLRLEIIRDNPIGNGHDAFHALFNTVCSDTTISRIPDALGQLDQEELRKLIRSFLRAAQTLPAADLLPATTHRGTLRDDLLRLELSLRSDDFDLDRIKPLLNAALADHLDDALIWGRVYDAVTESTPPPRPIDSFVNLSEHRKYVDNVLKEELGPMYVGLRDFYKTYFGDRGWPEEAKQDDVLSWFADFTKKLAAFKRRPLAKPDEPIAGSVAKRKIDIGFTQILVPGELKSNPSADTPSEARLDPGRYAREVLAAQDTRRFVLGFTLCGSLMGIWVFDRLGGIASEQFDINKDSLRFVSTILGFLWMSEEELRFDPTIMTAKGQRFIEIEREGTTERLILDATTCWKAYREEDLYALFVVKDSWQYLERDDEGRLLREATGKGAVHVAWYYHYETVWVRNVDDDVRNNIRKGLDVTKATNYRQNRSRLSPSTSTAGLLRAGRSSSIASAKRSSDQTGAPLPPSKRPCSTSPTKAGSDTLPNRVYRRMILSDYGIPIYEASSREALLAALADCIEGHKSLRREAGLLHRDISIGNLMVS